MTSTASVEDRLAIRELVEHYSDAVARKDKTDWSATWAENATWGLPGLEVQGRDKIVALWVDAIAGYSLVVQYLTCGKIEISGSTATGSWYLLEAATKQDGTELFVSGNYRDSYEKGSDGKWRFTERKYHVQQVRGDAT